MQQSWLCGSREAAVAAVPRLCSLVLSLGSGSFTKPPGWLIRSRMGQSGGFFAFGAARVASCVVRRRHSCQLSSLDARSDKLSLAVSNAVSRPGWLVRSRTGQSGRDFALGPPPDHRGTVGSRGPAFKRRVLTNRLSLFFTIDRSSLILSLKLGIKLEKRGEKKKEREAIRQNAWTNVKLESVYCMSCMLCTALC